MDVPIFITTQPPLPGTPPRDRNKDYWGLLDKHGLLSPYHRLSHPCFFLWGVHPKEPWNFLSQIVFVPIYETCRQPLFLQNLHRAFQNLNARASDPRRKFVSMKHLPATKSRATKPSRAEAIGATLTFVPEREEKSTSFLRRKRFAVDDAVASVSQRINLQHTLWESPRTLLGGQNSQHQNDGLTCVLQAQCLKKKEHCFFKYKHWCNNQQNQKAELASSIFDSPMQSLGFSFASRPRTIYFQSNTSILPKKLDYIHWSEDVLFRIGLKQSGKKYWKRIDRHSLGSLVKTRHFWMTQWLHVNLRGNKKNTVSTSVITHCLTNSVMNHHIIYSSCNHTYSFLDAQCEQASYMKTLTPRVLQTAKGLSPGFFYQLIHANFYSQSSSNLLPQRSVTASPTGHLES